MPEITDSQAGDDTWRSSSGTTYNINFSDLGESNLSYFQYTVYSNAGLAGTMIKDWTTVASSIDAASYTTDWQVDFASLQQGTNYVSVRVYDNALNTAQTNDVFYVKKDTSGPVITNNQTGDDTWRSASGTVYNIDFTDTNSLLNNAEYAVYSGTGLSGSQLKNWTAIASGINASTYTTDWQVDFAALQNGTNYVSVRISDNQTSSTVLTDAFYVKKDALAPSFTNNQTGDNTWRNTAGTVYNVDFSDTGNSNLSYAQYAVYSATGKTGTLIKDWTNIATGINASSYATDWSVDYNVLADGSNYVSVRAYDNAGGVITSDDVFYVRKDSTLPVVTNNQAGDNTWRSAAGTVYDVDFTDAGGFQGRNVFFRNNTATDHQNTFQPLFFDQFHDPGEQVVVGSREHAHGDDVRIFLDRGRDDLLRGLPEAGVYHFHAGIPQGGADDFDAPIVPV